MSDLIKIMLVEDDPRVCEDYRKMTSRHPNMAIVYATGSEQDALGYLVVHRVDVIILDIELEEGDGISFLETLVEREKEKPFVAVVTNTCSAIMLSYMREHGADYVYQKKNISYSAAKLLSVIEKICPYRKVMVERAKPLMVDKFRREKDDDVKRMYVEDELLKMGFQKKHLGFTYITDAVMILMDYSGIPPHVTSEIYPLIAKHRNVSRESVERSIRHAIGVTFANINAAQLNYYYPYPYDEEVGRPTNRDFLTRFAQKIRL